MTNRIAIRHNALGMLKKAATYHTFIHEIRANIYTTPHTI